MNLYSSQRSQRQFRLAIVGAFDIENYGDLLFPIVFRDAMRSRLGSVGVTVFAPTDFQPNMGQDFGRVHSVESLDDQHSKDPFDAVILGGGAIVHGNLLAQHLPNGEFVENYPIAATWVSASLFAARTGVPVLWNAPDVPYRFAAAVQTRVRRIISASDYICVRNESSKHNLVAVGIAPDRIRVVPDSALSLAVRPVFQEAPSSKSPRERTVLIHLNRYIEEAELDRFAIEVGRFGERNDAKLRIIGLAKTHDDDVALGLLKERLGDRLSVSPALTLSEIVSEVRRCSLYVGVSYHGMITALCAGVPAVAYNFMRYAKTRDLYNELELSNLYCETASDLVTILTEFPELSPTTRGNLESMALRVEAHFDEIASKVMSSDPARVPTQAAVPDDGQDLDIIHLASLVEQSRSSVAALLSHLSESETSVSQSLAALVKSTTELLREQTASRDYFVSKVSWLEGELARTRERLSSLEESPREDP